jgi:hypothetical protein
LTATPLTTGQCAAVMVKYDEVGFMPREYRTGGSRSPSANSPDDILSRLIAHIATHPAQNAARTGRSAKGNKQRIRNPRRERKAKNLPTFPRRNTSRTNPRVV